MKEGPDITTTTEMFEHALLLLVVIWLMGTAVMYTFILLEIIAAVVSGGHRYIPVLYGAEQHDAVEDPGHAAVAVGGGEECRLVG